MNADLTTAADVRSGSGVGIIPLSSVRTVPGSTGAVLALPRAPWAADVLGRQRFTAQHVVLGQVATKQDSIQPYYAPKTRIAAASGGVPGAHPAREPV